MPRSPEVGRSVRCALAAVVAICTLSPAARAGTVEVVSRLDPSFASDTPGSYSLTYRAPWAVSADGRYSVFTSRANNVIDGQVESGNFDKVFLHDRQTGTLTMVSHALGSASTAVAGTNPVISADGRWIAYLSTATNLIAGHVERNGGNDVFLYDRLSDTTVLVSHLPGAPASTGNGACSRPQVSDDGSFVAYFSTATDLVAGQTDTNAGNDVFLYERTTNTNTLVSRTASSATAAGNGVSSNPALSGDGAWVAFASRATDLAAGVTDTNNADDVYLYERATGAATLVSHSAASATTAGSAGSIDPLLGQDGAWLAFVSTANNLVAGQVDANGVTDVFLYDRATGASSLVSHVASSAVQATSYTSATPSMSVDGRWIAFATSAPNVVAGQVDTNAGLDVFLYDRTTGTSSLVSHVPASAVTAGSGGNASAPAISRDGSRVAFQGTATNLAPSQSDTNGTTDVFVFTQATGAVALASHTSAAAHVTGGKASQDAVIAGDGSSVLFYSIASNLLASVNDKNNTGDVFRFEPATLAVSLVSRRAPSLPALTPNNSSELGQPQEGRVSADGRWVVFGSYATDLVAGQVDASSTTDVFLYDRATRTTTLVSHVPGSAVTTANGSSYDATVSADGRYVAFVSDATNVVAGQTGDFAGTYDVFLFDRQGGTVTLVSHVPANAAKPAFCCSDWPTVTADGSAVVYRSDAQNLVAGQSDTNNSYDIVHWDRATNTNVLVSHAFGAGATAANGRSWPYAVSADGSWVAYSTSATNLMAAFTDGNGVQSDIFLWERATDTTTLVTAAAGLPTTGGNSYPGEFSISADGRNVAFDSNATNLVAGQTGTAGNVFVHDRVAGARTLASHAVGSTTQAANNISLTPRISDDGSWVAYQSRATNLATGITDTNNAYDIYVHERATGANTLVSHSSALSRTIAANNISDFPAISANGGTIIFRTAATNVIAGSDTNTKTDVIFYDRPTRTAYFASRSLASAITAANNQSTVPIDVDASGDAAVFQSIATNLVGQDFNNQQDLFLYSHKPVADLAIAKTDGTATVSPGQTLTWTITVTNLGPAAVTGATVTDVFPAAVTGVLWTCAGTGGGTCTASGSGNIADTVSLPAGATVTYSANGVLDPGASGTLANTAQVAVPAGTVDLEPANNSATDIDTVQ